MSTIHLHLPSFNAGEISPLLGARFGVEKVQSGCRQLRNFIPHVHGPVFRRPGMEYMGASAGDGARSSLRGYNFSTSTGSILEFHPAGLQVWTNGARVSLRTPVTWRYTAEECAEIQVAQVNDVCYLAHPNHPPCKLVRHAEDDWRLEEIPWKWPALGDENVRALESTMPEVTVLKSAATEQWPEFIMPRREGTLRIVSPDLSAKQKKLTVERWSGGRWARVELMAWTTIAPFAKKLWKAEEGEVWRMRYEGPVAITGGKAEIVFGLDGLPELLAKSLALDVAQPVSQQQFAVPAGDWQLVVVCPAVLPAGGSVQVERVSGQGGWVAEGEKIKLVPEQTIVVRGRKLPQGGTFRLVWPAGVRAMAGTMKLEAISFPPVPDVALAVNVVNGESRTMTAAVRKVDEDDPTVLKPMFEKGHEGSFWQITHRRKTAHAELVVAAAAFGETKSPAVRVAGRWEVFSYGRWDATLYLEKFVSGGWEVVRSWSSRYDRNIVTSGDEEQEVEMRLRVSAGEGEDADTAAAPRFVLEAVDARTNGLVKITHVPATEAEPKVATCTVDILTTLHSTEPTTLWTEGAWSQVRGFPRTVALHGQRLFFGGTQREPLRIWGSVVNDYENFRRSSLDDASVDFTPAAQQSNPLQWMASHGQDLVLGTLGDEWTLSGGTESGPITPTSVLVQRRSGYGSSQHPALLLGEVIVFLQRGGRKIRQVAPRAQGIVWTATDLMVLAEHLGQTEMVQAAVMHFPHSILWAVSRDGKLLGMTYEQEQNVFAWHVHETEGFVESVAVVYGIESDEVWLQVRRGSRRGIERLDPAVFARRFEQPEKLIYLDAARRYESATGVATLTGLEHLEGREVAVLADGAELSRVVVQQGAVALPAPARTAIVGLPFTSVLQPMRLELQMQDGSAQHRRWRTTRVGLYLHASLGGEIADGPEGRAEKLNFRRVATPMDAPPPLYTGEIETALESRARPGVDVVVRTSGPHPLNIGSLTVKGDIYGE